MRQGNFQRPGYKNNINLPAVSGNKQKNEVDTVRDTRRNELINSNINDIFDLTTEGLFKRFESLSKEISSIFDGFIKSMPKMEDIQDIKVLENDVIINANIPGMSTDDLDININEDYVRLSGRYQRSNEYRNMEDNSYRAQKSYSAFVRTIPLPAKVNYRLAKVEYKGDTLSISIPKL
ncbi:MAG TPA: Hsp20/alpha crystallin family protein [Clostridia bacterium]